jgi:hypothetical protein
VKARAAAVCATLVTTATLIGATRWLEASAPRAGSMSTLRAAAETRYAEGAPPGFTGGFNEQSCHACHFHADVNAAPGKLTIVGVPERFVPGERYPLTITLTRPGMTLGGFQLTARFKDGGAQAGTLAPAPDEKARIGIDLQADVQYAGHRREGATLAATDTARWALVWTAPKVAAAVAFHLAANAADGDERVEGDYIHTTVVEASPAGLPW